MVCAYWGKHWLLERFVVYMQKRNGMLQHSEYILDGLVNYEKGNVTKDDFIKLFETSSPPNLHRRRCGVIYSKDILDINCYYLYV